MNPIEEATKLYASELNWACNAEQALHVYQSGHGTLEQVQNHLDSADQAMNQAWDVLFQAGMNDRMIANLRHEAHYATAKALGWVVDQPIYINCPALNEDRVYTYFKP